MLLPICNKSTQTVRNRGWRLTSFGATRKMAGAASLGLSARRPSAGLGPTTVETAAVICHRLSAGATAFGYRSSQAEPQITCGSGG